MRQSYYRRLLLSFVLLVSGVAAGMSPIAAQRPDESEGVVLAFYHAGYGFNSWVPGLCDQPEQPYDSSNSGTITRHIQQAQDVGIDAFVQAWYGPELVQNPTETNLRTLLDRAQAAGFEVAALVDMTGDFLATADEVEAALVALRDRHSTHAAYLQMDGRPVVFFLGQDRRLTISQWETLRAQVDPGEAMAWIAEGDSTHVLGVFDGLYLYDIAETTQIGTLLYNTSSKINMWNLGRAVPAAWIATVIPGFDNRAVVVRTDDALERPRNSGQYYRQNWDAAIDSDPDWIVIRSFNEWLYCTHIEPSSAFGLDYLNLTGEMTDMYRESLQPPTPTPTVEVTAPTETSTATAEPTVVETPVMTATATLEAVATETPTPTLTLTPSATPFRLSTPTPSLEPGETRPPGPAPVQPPGVATQSPAAGPAGLDPPTVTPVPRLPVEGYAPRTCTLLPLWLPAAGLLLSRRRLSSSRLSSRKRVR